MLFRKDIEKICAYCARSGQTDSETLLCPKRGFVSPDNHCRHFRYDPLKRKPSRSKLVDFGQFKEEDFKL